MKEEAYVKESIENLEWDLGKLNVFLGRSGNCTEEYERLEYSLLKAMEDMKEYLTNG